MNIQMAACTWRIHWSIIVPTILALPVKVNKIHDFFRFEASGRKAIFTKNRNNDQH